MHPAFLDVVDQVAAKIVEDRVRTSLTRWIGIVERVAIGQHIKGWRITSEVAPHP